LWVIHSHAQTTAIESKTYSLASLKIRGAHATHPDQIRNISGLTEGQQISVPGYQISQAIKRVYRSELYEEVHIERDTVIGNTIHLTLAVKERPRISGIQITGIKKQQAEDLQEKMEVISGSLYSPAKLTRAKRIIRNFLIEKGYYHAEIVFTEKPDAIL